MESINQTAAEQETAPISAILPSPERHILRVLIVEDDLTFRPFWESVFARRKVHIDWATTSIMAENMMRMRFKKHHPYDLVIADIFLEGEGTGVDLWNRYGEETQNFIFVSGLPVSKYDLLMSLNFGCPIYLRKPLKMIECREILDSVLANNRRSRNAHY